MRILYTISLALFLLSSCQQQGVQGDFWISGLTLPAGSTVSETSEESFDLSEEPDRKYDSMHTLTVTFENQKGWQSVVASFDKQLGALGYSETQYSKLKGPESAASQAERDVMESSREYMNLQAGLTVNLMNMGAYSSKTNTFVMIVSKFE